MNQNSKVKNRMGKKNKKKKKQHERDGLALTDLKDCSFQQLENVVNGLPEQVRRRKEEIAARHHACDLFTGQPEDQVSVLKDIVKEYETLVQELKLAGDIALEQTKRHKWQAEKFEKKADDLALLFQDFRLEVDKSHIEATKSLLRDDVPIEVKDQLRTLIADNKNLNYQLDKLKKK